MSSYPLHTLQRLLRGTPTVRGAVVRTSGSSVQVATSSGLVMAGTSGSLMVGQAVMVRDGVAYPAANVAEGKVYPM